MSDAMLPTDRVPECGDAAPVYLWLLVPVGVSGVATTLGEADDAGHRAMDQHGDACAAGVFKAYPVPDWPYIRLEPDAAWTRSTHEWVAANIARAKAKKVL